MKTGRLLNALLILGFIATPLFSSATALDSTCTTVCPDDSSKILICHVPKGHPASAKELCIDPSDIAAHAKHGDLCGPCDSTIIDTTTHGKAPGPHGQAKGYSNNRDSSAWINIAKNHSAKHSIIEPIATAKDQLIISPNPFRGVTRIELNMDAEMVNVVLFDIAGRQQAVLHNGPISGSASFDLNANDLEPGIYWVQVVSGTNRLNQKIVVLK
jgi:hypothetical protein